MEGYNKPYKYCPARAIVSMVLGIMSIVYAACSGLYLLYEFLFTGLSGAALLAGTDAFESMTAVSAVYAVMFILGTGIFCGVAIAMAIVSLKQSKTFLELYEVESKMAKAGKITSTVGLILSGLHIAGSVILAIVFVVMMVLN